MNVEKLRQDFPLLKRQINGKPIAYLDNAATSLKPMQVINAVEKYYNKETANVHRGLHRLSEEASETYEESHKSVAIFADARAEEVVFTKNCTEAINLVMYSLKEKNFFKKGDKIVLSRAEHHSNLVPWQFLEKSGVKTEFVELNSDYTLDLEDFKEKAEGAKLVSVAHEFNTVASINPVKELAAIARKESALFFVDASQSIPHMPVSFKEIRADFMAFSGHKMLGPSGIGCLIGRRKLLEEMPPFLYGGDMIKHVSLHSSEWNFLPYKFEAGTPPIAESYGLKAAVEYLQEIGMNRIREHEKTLTKYALEKMEIEGLKIYCPKNEEKQGAIVLFEAEKIDCHDLSLALSESRNVFIRSGMHCAEPIVSSLNEKGLCRISMSFYNNEKDIDVFVQALKEIMKEFK